MFQQKAVQKCRYRLDRYTRGLRLLKQFYEALNRKMI